MQSELLDRDGTCRFFGGSKPIPCDIVSRRAQGALSRACQSRPRLFALVARRV